MAPMSDSSVLSQIPVKAAHHESVAGALFVVPVYLSASTVANSAIHPSGVGKWVVIHVIRYMNDGVKA